MSRRAAKLPSISPNPCYFLLPFPVSLSFPVFPCLPCLPCLSCLSCLSHCPRCLTLTIPYLDSRILGWSLNVQIVDTRCTNEQIRQ